MSKKISQEKRIQRILKRLTRKVSPGIIQEQLSNIYEEYTIVSNTEPEAEFWMKCAKASRNLSNGMTKWIHSMIDELETGEEEGTEGG